MKKLGLLIIAIFTLQMAFANNRIIAEEEICGKYKAKIIGTPEGDFDIVLKIWKEEGKLKAILDGEEKIEMYNVKTEGNKITMTMDAQGHTVDFDLKVEGDKISGYMAYDFEVKGERIKE